jgi:hypothetical protein
MSHDTSGSFRDAQAGDLIIGPADLERADPLEVLGFENHSVSTAFV